MSQINLTMLQVTGHARTLNSRYDLQMMYMHKVCLDFYDLSARR